jgi:hypothetical protein
MNPTSNQQKYIAQYGGLSNRFKFKLAFDLNTVLRLNGAP